MLRTLAFWTLLMLLAVPAWAQSAPSGLLTDLELPGPLTREQADYLGVPKDAASFRLSEIKGEYLLLEVFSMYCPHCQREAPRVNELYRAVAASPYAGRILFLGLGAGNSAFEVDVFRKQYKVPFPLFADPDFLIHKAVGQVGTPCFLFLKLPGQGQGLPILDSLIGGFGDTQAYLQRLVRAGRIEK